MALEKIITTDSLNSGKDKINKIIDVLSTVSKDGGNEYNSGYNVDGSYYNTSFAILNDVNSSYVSINVEGGEEYSLQVPNENYNSRLGFFDSNKVFVSQIVLSTYIHGLYNGKKYVTFKTPTNASYIGFNTRQSTFDNRSGIIFVKGKNITESKLGYPKLTSFLGYKVDTSIEDSITLNNSNIYAPEKNLVSGSYINVTTGLVNIADGWAVADIDVTSGEHMLAFKGTIYGSMALTYFNDETVISVNKIYDRAFSKKVVDGYTIIRLSIPTNTTKMQLTIRQPDMLDYSNSLFVQQGYTEDTSIFDTYVTSIAGYKISSSAQITTPTNSNASIKWVALGDSLTEKNIRANTNYVDYVTNQLGVTSINHGVSGSGYKRHDDIGKSFYQRALLLDPDFDVITIFGSGNDGVKYGEGVQIGSITDSTTETLAGCVNKTIDNILSINPKAKIGIIAPTPWEVYKPADEHNFMSLYTKMLSDISKSRGLPFLDLYHNSGLRPWDANFKTIAYSKDEGGGVHPDEFGHTFIAPKVSEFIKTLTLIQ